MRRYQTDGIKIGHKLQTELFPNNSLNETTVASVVGCAQLCNTYLYCTTFSYNEATHGCRFVVGMNVASNSSALVVQ
jgi:hypothetical protein